MLGWIRLLSRAKRLIVIGADVLDEGYGTERSRWSLKRYQGRRAERELRPRGHFVFHQWGSFRKSEA